MRPTGTLLQLAVCLSSITPLTAAWPGWLPDLDSIIVRRADSTETAQASETASATGASSTGSSNSPKTTNLNTANLNTAKVETGTETGTDTATATGTETGTNKDSKTTATGTGKKTSKATHTTYGANDAAGGVSLQTPQTTVQVTPLYKIGDYVTFGWNYTSLQGTPTAIDVLVSCSTASQTWTLTQNMTFETKVSYVWDTNKDGNVAETPLLTQLYTLIIKDSDASISDTADPGYLGTYTGLKFGLYTPKPYTPLSQWTCVGCNAANSNLDPHALGFALTMSIITIATFTWFVTGLGLQ